MSGNTGGTARGGEAGLNVNGKEESVPVPPCLMICGWELRSFLCHVGQKCAFFLNFAVRVGGGTGGGEIQAKKFKKSLKIHRKGLHCGKFGVYCPDPRTV